MAPLTEEQLKRRSHGIGASEIGAVCGLDPFKRPIDIWLKKTGREVLQPDTEESLFRKSLGHKMEGVIADMYREKVACWLCPCGTLTHPQHDWALATPDRIWSSNDRLVEIKNVGYHMAHHWGDGAPDYVVAQVQWQMEVANIEHADIAALLGGRDFVVHPVERDREMAAMMIEIGGRFWRDNVLADAPPPADGSNAYKEFLKRRYPNDDGPELAADDEIERWAHAYETARAQGSAAEAQQEEAGNHLRYLLGNSCGAFGRFGKVTLKKNAHGTRVLKVSMRKAEKEAA